MNSLPKVSIILPTKNRLSLLKRSINSIFDQDYESIELVITDDGSSDGTKEYLENLIESRNDVITILNTTSQGACVCRNKAIDAATGIFITFLDDDDYLKSNHISNLISYWSKDYSCISANMARIVKGKEKVFAYYSGSIDLDKYLFYNRIGINILTLTSRIKAVGGFDERFPALQDYECWIRILKKYGPALKVPESTYMLDNQHDLERISSNSSRKIAGLDMLLKKHSQDIKPKQFKSLSLLRKHLLKENITLIDVIMSVHIDNLKFVLSRYLSQFYK